MTKTEELLKTRLKSMERTMCRVDKENQDLRRALREIQYTVGDPKECVVWSRERARLALK